MRKLDELEMHYQARKLGCDAKVWTEAVFEKL